MPAKNQRKPRTLAPKKPQPAPTYRISIKGEPKYFLEPTWKQGTVFLGCADTQQILGLLTDGEIITDNDPDKMYYLSKIGLMPKEENSAMVDKKLPNCDTYRWRYGP